LKMILTFYLEGKKIRTIHPTGRMGVGVRWATRSWLQERQRQWPQWRWLGKPRVRLKTWHRLRWLGQQTLGLSSSRCCHWDAVIRMNSILLLPLPLGRLLRATAAMNCWVPLALLHLEGLWQPLEPCRTHPERVLRPPGRSEVRVAAGALVGEWYAAQRRRLSVTMVTRVPRTHGRRWSGIRRCWLSGERNSRI